jgi:hypothetical protein
MEAGMLMEKNKGVLMFTLAFFHSDGLKTIATQKSAFP